MALAAEADVRKEFHLPDTTTLSFSALPEYPRLTNRLQAWDYGRVLMPVISVETDGLTFLFNGKDNSMSKSMFLSGETYPKSQMDFCLMMLKKRGVFDLQKKRIFLEIGANVGTTTLYMKKKLGNNWDALAFEPMTENYRLLQAAIALNGMRGITCENLGISDKPENLDFGYVVDNPGGSGADQLNGLINFRSVSCTTIDDYVQKNALHPADIGFIWMDTEAHEAYAVDGGMKVLKDSPALMFLEYNPSFYKKQGTEKSIVSNLSEVYTHFVCYEQIKNGRADLRPICDLVKIAGEQSYNQCNILLWK